MLEERVLEGGSPIRKPACPYDTVRNRSRGVDWCPVAPRSSESVAGKCKRLAQDQIISLFSYDHSPQLVAFLFGELKARRLV